MDDATIEAARKGCCDDQRKPCTYHEGWADALATLPDPRPTEAEVEQEYNDTGDDTWRECARRLGCFRPEEDTRG